MNCNTQRTWYEISRSAYYPPKKTIPAPICLSAEFRERYLYPCDEEILELLEQSYPNGLTTKQILRGLQQMSDPLNKSYRETDVENSLGDTLRPYTEHNENNNRWFLKSAK